MKRHLSSRNRFRKNNQYNFLYLLFITSIGLCSSLLIWKFNGSAAKAAFEPNYNPATPEFVRMWERTDRPVKEGRVARTWMWGPNAFTALMEEQATDRPGGTRKVQYFDKSRMELNPGWAWPWTVTNGLLVTEMIDGRIQIGQSDFLTRTPADIATTGDPGETKAPMYVSLSGLKSQPARTVTAVIDQRIDRFGNIQTDSALRSHNVTGGRRARDDVSTAPDHVTAKPFWDFMNSSGLIYDSSTGQYRTDKLFENPYYATGLPITEAYWVRATINNTLTDVLVQAFERRILTYRPANPEGWKVESGNVGQHYYDWRYNRQTHSTTEQQKLTQAASNYEDNVNGFLNRMDSQIFDSTYFNSLPAQYDTYMRDKRWFAGGNLINTALMYGLKGDFAKQNTYMSKAWKYTKESNTLNLPGGSNIVSGFPSLPAGVPDQKSTAVFPMLEYAFALKTTGNGLQSRNPQMVNEILDYLIKVANIRVQEYPVGNPNVADTHGESIYKNSYAETLAGNSALLAAVASLAPNNPNKSAWLAKSREFALAALSLGEQVGVNSSVRTAYTEGNDLKLGNHLWRFHPSYQLTTVGLLGQAEYFARLASGSTSAYRHQTDWAVQSVMRYVNSSDLYTIAEANDTNGKDDWLEDWKNQLWSGYISDTDLIVRKASNMPADHTINVITTQFGIWSPTFQADKDSNFVKDTVIMLKGVDIYRKVVQLVELQQRTGQSPHVGTRAITLYSNTTK